VVSPNGQRASKPERLTSRTGLISDASLSVDGKLAFTSRDVSEQIYVIPTAIEPANSPREPLHLAGTEAIRNLSPSMSRDGRWMAYGTTEESNNQTKIRLKDLVSGNDRVIAEKSDLFDRDFLSLSPDGSKVVFARLDVTSDGGKKSSVLSSYMVSASGGAQQKICELCLPRGFSSDGSLLLFQEPAANEEKLDHIISINLVSGTKKLFLSDADKPLYHAFFSWDDHWVVFKKLLRLGHGQLLIAPVRNGAPAGKGEWIAVTDGAYDDDKPQFSADGNNLYFTSDRDGYLCIWAVRLNPATKHPEGAPFAIKHFHNAAGWFSKAYYHFGAALSVGREKMATNLIEPRTDIWMMKLK
jgi:eukaryotic-like serine/threonine-protein kinase